MALAPWEAEERPPIKSLEAVREIRRESSPYTGGYLSPQNPNTNYSLGNLEKQVQK